MDYSNYTLLSVGCSFTFGQGVIEHFNNANPDSPDSTKLRSIWRKKCNELSYTARVGRRLKFKKVVNLGTPAGSNELALLNMNTWLDKNSGENVFVLFSMADPQREFTFKKVKGAYDETPNSFGLEVFNTNHPQGISQRAIETFYTEINTDITMTFKNWLFRKQLSSALKYRNLPHLVFHAYDPMDVRITKMRKMFKLRITKGTTHWHDLDIMPDFYNWLFSIEDEPTFESYIGINKIIEWTKSEDWSKDLKDIITPANYVEAYCKRNQNKLFKDKSEYGTRGASYSPFDNAHYNKQAHAILGDKLSQEIRKIN